MKRVRRGEYLCEHCCSHYYVNGEDEAESEEEAEARLAALLVEASEYEARDDIPAELHILLKGLDIAPQNINLLLKLGRSYWRLGQNQKAMEYFERAEASDPGNPIISIGMGDIYLTQGLYAEAKTLYEKGLSIMEANPLSATANDITVSLMGIMATASENWEIVKARKNISRSQKRKVTTRNLWQTSVGSWA